MRVIWDHQAFSYQRFGGVSRAFAEILKRLPANIHVEMPMFFGQNQHLQGMKTQLPDPIQDFRGKIYLKKKINHKLSLFKLKKSEFDLFHATFYDSYFLKDLSKPLVITVHDCIHEQWPDSLPQREKRVLNQKAELIRKANAIIAVSQSTKNAIVAHYPDIDRSKIHVIYHGIEHLKSASIKRPISEKYILHIGSRVHYKNFETTLRALNELRRSSVDIKLLCVGGGPLTYSEYKVINHLKIKDHVKYIQGGDDFLANCYFHAEAYVSSSNAEGFGIPIVEAMHYGCPIVCSDISVYREIASDAAHFFPAGDHVTMAAQIISVLNGKGKTSEHIAKMKRNIVQFSWLKAAENLATVYETILK